jgi:REP element-mobilizing transposase RayT
MTAKPNQAAQPVLFARRKPRVLSFPKGTPILITWRLHGSLPELSDAELADVQKLPGRQRMIRIEKLLDAAQHGPTWLKDERVAEMVCDSIERSDSEFKRYTLHSYVVMPNHVHILVKPIAEVSAFMKELKGVTARRANLILERTGNPFWQSEVFDRWSRNDAHFKKIQNYIAMNPVWAGLSKIPEEFPWSSAHRKPISSAADQPSNQATVA